MTPSERKLRDEALRLTPTQRMDLAAALLESVEGEPDAGVLEAWLDEVRRRAQELESGEVAALPIEELFRHMTD